MRAPTHAARRAIWAVAATILAAGACHLDDVLGTPPGNAPSAPDDSVTTPDTPATPARLTFAVQPANVRAGVPISPAVEVRAVTRDGEPATEFSGPITVSRATPADGGTLGGTTTRPAVSGVARFDDLTLGTVGTDYTLRAEGAGLAVAVSRPFAVVPADAAALAGAGGDAQSDTIGATLASPYVVRVTDAEGNPVAGVSVSWSIGDGGGSVSGAAGTDAEGLAEGTHTLGTAAGPQTVLARADGLAGSPVTFSATARPGAPHQLAFDVPPSDADVDDPISPAVVVSARDRGGNAVADDAGMVAVRLGENPGGGTLTGDTRAAPAGGNATFASLRIDRPGAGYTLEAELGGAPRIESPPFDVDGSAGPTAIAAVAGDSQTDTVRTTLAPFVVRVTDDRGQGVDGVTVQWAVTGGGGSISPTASVTDADGLASATRTLGTQAGTHEAEARVNGLAGSPVEFTGTTLPGAATSLIYTTQPTDTRAGAPISPAVRVELRDAHGNVATTFTGSVSIDLVALTGTPGATLSGTRTRTPADGIAVFDDLSIDLVGVAYRLRATGAGRSVESAAFDVQL